MQNIITRSSNNNQNIEAQPVAFELNEQDLEQINGGHGHHYNDCHQDCYSYCSCRHHRHHGHCGYYCECYYYSYCG